MNKLNLLTAQIVSNYVANNGVNRAEIPGIIATVSESLQTLDRPSTNISVESVLKRTPTQIRKSITEEGIVCFEDGRTYKILKRRLAVLGMTPAEYRVKWGLPADYPMIAPSHSKARSDSAKARGLGVRHRTQDAVPEPTPVHPSHDDRAA